MINKKMPLFRNVILSFSFKNYLYARSGMPKVIMEHQEMFNKSNISYLYLYFVKKEINKGKNLFFLFGVIIDGIDYGIYDINQLIEMLQELLNNGFNIVDIHAHHFMYANLEKINSLFCYLNSVPIKVFLHDFYLCCTNYQLLKNGEYCCAEGSLGSEKCIDCKSYTYSLKKEKELHSFLSKFTDRIIFIAPSEAVKEMYLSFHENYMDKVFVVPHLKFFDHYKENLKLENNKKIRVAYLGANNRIKGWNIWEKLVRAQHNNYDFFVFNSMPGDYKYMKKINVEYSPDEPFAMVQALRSNKIDVAVLCSTVFETYSYTCMEAYMANAFIVTCTGSGNIERFVREMKCGIVFDSEEKIEKFFEQNHLFYQHLQEFKNNYVGGGLYAASNNKIVEMSVKTKSSLDANINYNIKRKYRYSVIEFIYKIFIKNR